MKKPKMHVTIEGRVYDWEGTFPTELSAEQAARGLRIRHEDVRILRHKGKYHIYSYAGGAK